MINTKEIWKPVKNYEGYYEVSNLGNVRSVDRVIYDNNSLRVFKGKLLKPSLHNGKQPYYYVSLCKGSHNKKVLVHRLVAETFIPNPLNKPQVNHIDGNVHNNIVTNLEFVTNAENTQHAYDTKLNMRKQLHITYKGKTQSLSAWCRELNLNYKLTHCRYRYLNWSIEKCFEGGDVKCLV